jgi:hypothetical protein
VPVTKNEPAYEPQNPIDWQKIGEETKEITAMVVLTIAGIALTWYARVAFLKQQFTTPPPFTHTIDRRNLEA